MGQLMTAILYGIKMDKPLRMQFAPAPGNYDPSFEGPLDEVIDFFYDQHPSVHLEDGDEVDCLGFTLAVSGEDDYGAARISSTFSLEDVPTIWPDQYALALENWEKLRAFVKEHRPWLDLPEPSLLITCVERA